MSATQGRSWGRFRELRKLDKVATSGVHKMDELEKAYIAGIFDGEGTIGIRKRFRNYRSMREYWECNVAVANTNEDLMLWLQSRIGGYLSSHQHKNPNCKRNYILKLRAYEARHVLPQLLPYLRIKRTQADVVLAFLFDQQRYPKPGTIGHPDRVIEFRRDLYKVASIMNAKGVSNGTA